jgi:hypothetical protein
MTLVYIINNILIPSSLIRIDNFLNIGIWMTGYNVKKQEFSNIKIKFLNKKSESGIKKLPYICIFIRTNFVLAIKKSQ